MGGKDASSCLAEAIERLAEPIEDESDLRGVEVVLDGIASAIVTLGLVRKPSANEAPSLEVVLRRLQKSGKTPVSESSIVSAEALADSTNRAHYDNLSDDTDEQIDRAEEARQDLYACLKELTEKLT